MKATDLEEAVKYNFAVVDANDMDKVVGFASDLSDAKDIARRHTKNGFTNGKIIKLKKPMSAKKGDMMVNRELSEDSVDGLKHDTLNDMFMALEQLNREYVELDTLDRDPDSSGAGDLTDQLTTMRKHIEGLYMVLDRASKVVPKG